MSREKWNDVLHARLVELIAEGKFASEIATMVNDQYGTHFTRNAVIGRSDRSGLTFAGQAKRQRATPDETKRIARRLREKSHSDRKLKREIAERTGGFKARAEAFAFLVTEPTDLPPDSSAFACTMAELTEQSCRYPLGDPRTTEFRYCGDRKLTTSSYCARHHLLCWRLPDKPNKRRSVPAASVETPFGLMRAAE